MISDNYLLFGDYNRLAFDSINDCLAASKRNARNDQARDEWMEAIEKWTYFFVTLTDLTKQQTTVQAYDILRSYEYTYPTPHMEWQLIPGDTLIQNRPCKKLPAHSPDGFMWPGTQSLFRFLTDLICLADCPV